MKPGHLSQTRVSPLTWLALSAMVLFFGACGGTTIGNPETSVEDSSASGSAAAAVGGALSGSSSKGTLASLERQRSGRILPANWSLFPEAWASVSCPTFQSSSGSGCSESGSALWLTYGDCEFGHGGTAWQGVVMMSMSGGTASCGSFPNPGAGGSLYRQYVSSSLSTSPGSVTLTTSYGTSEVVDDQTSNLSNFNGDGITAVLNGGYGVRTDFNGLGARSQVTLGHRIVSAGHFDHSITGALALSEAIGATSRTLNGTVTVYHNLLKVIGQATFDNVVHKDTCCVPVSGTITTTFRAGSVSATSSGQAMIGKTETLTLTGCGTGTLQQTDGSTTSVVISRCF